MKKILKGILACLALIAMLSCVLIGCGGSEEGNKAEGEATHEAAPAEHAAPAAEEHGAPAEHAAPAEGEAPAPAAHGE